MEPTEFSRYLQPTPTIDSDHPAIARLAAGLAGAGQEPAAVAVRLFDWVRDHVRYDPYQPLLDPAIYKASRVLEQRRGYCVQKAILLAALGRAAGIATRLAFADVRNHQIPDKMRQLMGTDVFVFHGYVEFHLGGRWLKATPAFDADLSVRQGILPVRFDGRGDATFHPVDPHGQPHMEYLGSRGAYADLPFEALRRAFIETYAGTMDPTAFGMLGEEPPT